MTEEIIGRFAGCGDFAVRRVGEWVILYFENLCERRFIHEYILTPLTQSAGRAGEDVITCGEISFPSDVEAAVKALLTGEAVVIWEKAGENGEKTGADREKSEGEGDAVALGSGDGQGDEKAGKGAIFAEKAGKTGIKMISVKVQSELARGVSEPETETVIRGPREGFTERAGNNAALIRRRIRSPYLHYESLTVGKKSGTQVILMYLSDIVNRAALKELKARLSTFEADAILDSGQLELWLEGNPFPMFPSIGNSERPDKVAAKILEGRIALIVDGTPVVLTVPYLFVESLQSTEDYGKALPFAVFVRLLRFSALVLSMLLPAVYLALFLFHEGALPADLLAKIEESRQAVPFPPFLELTLTLLAFELIREVAIRMPRSVGSAVGLVAALILGDSAISAGFTSAPALIITAITALATFLVPPYMNSVILFRLGFLFLGGYFGLLGIGAGICVLLIHLSAKESFTVPYCSPFAPISLSGMGDFLLVLPPWGMKKLPSALTGLDRTRRRRKESSDDET